MVSQQIRGLKEHLVHKIPDKIPAQQEGPIMVNWHFDNIGKDRDQNEGST